MGTATTYPAQPSQRDPPPHGLGLGEAWSCPNGYQALRYRCGISRNATLEALVQRHARFSGLPCCDIQRFGCNTFTIKRT